jgi:uncharacterized protein YbaR (Trm112 family)
MKPWLLNILACPMDKHHPLDVHFFKWETTQEEIKKINREAGQPNKYFKKQYRHLAKQIGDNTISPQSLRVIKDKTGSMETMELQADVVKFLDRLIIEEPMDENELLKRFPEGVDILYRYLNLLEVEEGILHCPECGRWYPIGSSVETIPELLPDDLREKEKDLEWMKKWEEKIPENIIQSGKPYHI